MAAHRNPKYDAAVHAYQQGATLRDIADDLGVHHEVVRKALKRRGVQFRTDRSERQKHGSASHMFRGGSRAVQSSHVAVYRALKSGKLVRQPCEICGSEKVEAHHDDYSKPLEVRWLCNKHHHQWHRENVARG